MGICVGFIGHRDTPESDELKAEILKTVESLIVDFGADDFLFGSKSNFNSLCLEAVTKLKEKYPHIIREFIRGEYEHIPDWYEEYLMQYYEKTEFPASVHNAGINSYVKRNCHIIDRCDILVVYYIGERSDLAARYNRLSRGGTHYAVGYATKRGKKIINLFTKA